MHIRPVFSCSVTYVCSLYCYLLSSFNDAISMIFANTLVAIHEYIPKSAAVILVRFNSAAIMFLSTSSLLLLRLSVLFRLFVLLLRAINIHIMFGRGIPNAEHLKLTLRPCSCNTSCGGAIITGATTNKTDNYIHFTRDHNYYVWLDTIQH